MPAAKPVAVAEVWPFDQLKVYPGFPPEPAAVAEPVPPLQLTDTLDAIEAVTAVGCVIVTLAVAEQLFTSLTVTV